MSYTVAPDVTTSSVAINSAATANPSLTMTQLGGGFTWSKDLPLYLEGNAALSRFDPTFVASDGTDQRQVPVKWDALSVTAGIGWDFPLAPNWVLRPMLNLSYGTLKSDLSAVKWWLDNNTNLDLVSLDHGTLKAHGIGGSLMIDYESFAPDADVDMELRYTNVKLRNSGALATQVNASASAESASLWARRRIPTGWVVWDRPVRYVLEGAYTRFLGSQTEIGVDRMASVWASASNSTPVPMTSGPRAGAPWCAINSDPTSRDGRSVWRSAFDARTALARRRALRAAPTPEGVVQDKAPQPRRPLITSWLVRPRGPALRCKSPGSGRRPSPA